MRKYVVGFMFDEKMRDVALVHKQHGPLCTIGKWNGVGGKVDEDEDFVRAMAREFYEETGVATQAHEWHEFAELRGDEHCIVFYWCQSNLVYQVKTLTDEPIRVVQVATLNTYPVMENLLWMIPFLCDRSCQNNLGVLIVNRSDA